MKPPKTGYGKEWVVKWLGNDGETMYSGAMTEEEAKRLVVAGHWHSKAFPVAEKIK
jgi:hypothetical protein